MAEDEAVKEVAKQEPESAVEVPKVIEEPPTIVEIKESETVELNVSTQYLLSLCPSIILFICYFRSQM